MKRWDGVLEGYLEEYGSRGLSEERVFQVRRELERFGQWLKRRRPKPKLEEVGAELIVKYVRDRTSFRAKATVSGVMSVLRCFGEWLVREGHWQENPLRWLKGPKLSPFDQVPKRIGNEAMERLWQVAATTREPFYRYQWLAVLAVLYGTGFRRGELSRMDVDDWRLDELSLQCDGRKTGMERKVPVSEFVARCLEAYLPQRHNHLERLKQTSEKALFVNRAGERMKKEGISSGIHRLADRADVPLVSLHQFRHSCASDLLERGAKLPEVQKILGHRVITTTFRYLHISNPKRREAVELHPINAWL